MSTIPQLADAMRHVLTARADEAAIKSGFIKRRRKLDGASFVQALVFGWMSNPEATREERAQVAASRGVSISAYGLDKRLDERGAECLRRVLEAAVGQTIAAADPAAVEVLGRFEGVYLYDGSVVSLPEALRDEWPGLGGKGPTTGASALKIGVRLDLLSGELHGPVLGAGRLHEQRLPLEAEALPEGALRLADLGFLDLKLFRSLSEKGAYWLSRLRAAMVVRDPKTGDRMDLAALLKGLAVGQTLELEALLGEKVRVPARLLAIRVPEARRPTSGGASSERRRKGALKGRLQRRSWPWPSGRS